MRERSETVRDVALDDPRGAIPEVIDFLQRSMTPSIFSEPMRVFAELDVVKGIEDHANNLSKKFITPNGQAERALFPVPFWYRDPFCWCPLIALMSECFNDRIDLVKRHSINRVVVDAFGGCAFISVNLPICGQIQILVKQLSIHPFKR